MIRWDKIIGQIKVNIKLYLRVPMANQTDICVRILDYGDRLAFVYIIYLNYRVGVKIILFRTFFIELI